MDNATCVSFLRPQLENVQRDLADIWKHLPPEYQSHFDDDESKFCHFIGQYVIPRFEWNGDNNAFMSKFQSNKLPLLLDLAVCLFCPYVQLVKTETQWSLEFRHWANVAKLMDQKNASLKKFLTRQGFQKDASNSNCWTLSADRMDVIHALSFLWNERHPEHQGRREPPPRVLTPTGDELVVMVATSRSSDSDTRNAVAEEDHRRGTPELLPDDSFPILGVVASQSIPDFQGNAEKVPAGDTPMPLATVGNERKRTIVAPVERSIVPRSILRSAPRNDNDKNSHVDVAGFPLQQEYQRERDAMEGSGGAAPTELDVDDPFATKASWNVHASHPPMDDFLQMTFPSSSSLLSNLPLAESSSLDFVLTRADSLNSLQGGAIGAMTPENSSFSLVHKVEPEERQAIVIPPPPPPKSVSPQDARKAALVPVENTPQNDAGALIPWEGDWTQELEWAMDQDMALVQTDLCFDDIMYDGDLSDDEENLLQDTHIMFQPHTTCPPSYWQSSHGRGSSTGSVGSARRWRTLLASWRRRWQHKQQRWWQRTSLSLRRSQQEEAHDEWGRYRNDATPLGGYLDLDAVTDKEDDSASSSGRPGTSPVVVSRKATTDASPKASGIRKWFASLSIRA